MRCSHAGIGFLTTFLLVLLLHGCRLSSGEENPCKSGIQLFAFGGDPKASALRSPGGTPLPASKDPILVLHLSDIERAESVPATDRYVPEIGKRVSTPESIAILLTEKGTKKFTDYVRAHPNVPWLYASCDGRVAEGTLSYPLNFDEVVARDGRGYVWVSDDLDPKPGVSPTP